MRVRKPEGSVLNGFLSGYAGLISVPRENAECRVRNAGSGTGNKDQQESVLYCTSYTIDYENQDAGCFVNICGFTADDEQTENLFFKSESIEAGKWTEELNSILFDKIQVTVCVAFEDGTSKTQTIAIAAAASDANSTYEKGQTQKEKLIQYEMR